MTIQIRDVVTRKTIGLFSDFSSLIWTERFQKFGDFELILPKTEYAVNLFKLNRFITIPSSKNMMIITTIEYGEDEIKITGKSLEYILSKRIIYEWRDVEKEEHLKSLIESVISKSITNPEIAGRKIENVSLNYSVTSDPNYSLKIITDINRGDIVSDAIYGLCSYFDFGLKAEFDVYNKGIEYVIYEGKDRREIVFSQSSFNFKRSTYVESVEDFRSSVLVAGEGSETKRKMVTVSRQTEEKIITEEGEEIIKVNAYRGIERNEGFVDARDIQKKTSESLNNYKIRLKNRGISDLQEHSRTYAIDGEIRDSKKRKIDVDYFLGDIVTIKDDFFRANVRITEVVQSWSSRGYEIYPTFEVINVLTNEISEEFNME